MIAGWNSEQSASKTRGWADVAQAGTTLASRYEFNNTTIV